MSSISLKHSVSTKSNNDIMYDFNRDVLKLKDKTNNNSKTTTAINLYLQVLSNATDATTFDPSTPVVANFFENLQHLFVLVESDAPVLWSAVKVLGTAIRTQIAHETFKDVINFIPNLALMFTKHVSAANKLALLDVLKDLTCGMQATGFIPNLEHLISTLCDFVSEEEINIKILALSILANICLREPAANFILAKTVDIRQFTKKIIKLSDESHVDKLKACVPKVMIIFDMNRVPACSRETYRVFYESTLQSINGAIDVKDHLDLRQHIEFFLKVDLKFLSSAVGKVCPKFLNHLLSSVESTKASTGDESMKEVECICLILRFLRALINNKLRGIDLPLITKLACNKMFNNLIASDALNLLKSALIASSNADLYPADVDERVKDLIIPKITKLLTDLRFVNEKLTTSKCLMNNYLFDILKIILREEEARTKILNQMKPEQFALMFDSMLNNPIDPERLADANHFSQDAFDMYLNALTLISLAGLHSADFAEFLFTLFEEKQVQTILALGLTSGVKERRANALEVITRNNWKLSKSIGDILFDIYPFQQTQTFHDSNYNDSNSVAKRMKLDEALGLLQESKKRKQICMDVTDVMDVYDSRLSVCHETEKTLTTYVEAATSASIKLMQQIASLERDLNRMHQIHLRSEAKQKISKKQIAELQKQVEELYVDKEKSEVLRQQTMAEVEKKNLAIEQLNAKLKEVLAEKEVAAKSISTLKESLVRIEKTNKRQEEANKALQAEVCEFKMHLQERDLTLKDADEKIQHLNEQLRASQTRSEEREKLFATIANMVNNGKK